MKDHRPLKYRHVLLMILLLGTLPGAGSALVLTHNADDATHSRLSTERRLDRDGCKAENDLRIETNRRVRGSARLRRSLTRFITETRDARLVVGRADSERFRLVINETVLPIVRSVPEKPVPLVNCERVYPDLVSLPAPPPGNSR